MFEGGRSNAFLEKGKSENCVRGKDSFYEHQGRRREEKADGAVRFLKKAR